MILLALCILYPAIRRSSHWRAYGPLQGRGRCGGQARSCSKVHLPLEANRQSWRRHVCLVQADRIELATKWSSCRFRRERCRDVWVPAKCTIACRRPSHFALPLAFAIFHVRLRHFSLSMALALWLRPVAAVGRLGKSKFAPAVSGDQRHRLFAHTFGWGTLGLLCFSAEAVRQHDRGGDGGWRSSVRPITPGDGAAGYAHVCGGPRPPRH